MPSRSHALRCESRSWYGGHRSARAMQITTDTRALVTGANGGIGAAIARALHAAGVNVTLAGRRADALRPLANTLSARVIVADLADRSALERCMDEAGPIDVLVANAAV